MQRLVCTIHFALSLIAIVLLSAQSGHVEAKSKLKAKAKAKDAAGLAITIAYFSQRQERPNALSNLEPFIPDKGEPGAELAIADNNTTGQFTRQHFVLKKFIVPIDGKAEEVFSKTIAGKFDFIIADLAAPRLLSVVDLPDAEKSLWLDISTTNDDLRNPNCRSNVLHLLPSRAMRADALAQYMNKKRWSDWFLVQGNTGNDRAYAEAIKRAAKRFGIDLVEHKTWVHTFDARRTAQSVVPVFTQVDDYDVLVVADEQGLFGDYLDYRTWLPRPVMGTQGLTAVAWHRTHEQWGAVQLQNRFKEKAGRWMEEPDYAAYLAIRALGEAATRTKSNQMQTVKDYLLSDSFSLQGYKGVPLSFRPWDGQLRQPILLAAPRSMVAVAPIEGFMHPENELDTLGYDKPESTCNWSAHEKP